MSHSRHSLQQLQSLATAAKQSGQRRLVILSGERPWGRELLAAWLAQAEGHRRLFVGKQLGEQPGKELGEQPDGKPAGPREVELAGLEYLPPAQAKALLGQQIDCLIYDGWEGIDAEALAAASGALVGGGLMLLLIPAIDQWLNNNDPDVPRLLVHPFQASQLSRRFIRLLYRCAVNDADVLLIEQKQEQQQEQQQEPQRNRATLRSSTRTSLPLPDTATLVFDAVAFDSVALNSNKGAANEGQHQAVQAIVKVATGHNRRPLVITANRGRGKSTALGLACAALLAQKNYRLLVTAPRREAVSAVFDAAASTLAASHSLAAGATEWLTPAGGSLSFIAPDALLAEQPTADLLLVDEAAAIPAAMLTLLLQRYKRIVFATTVHGYEGSGRGFDIRFKATLNRLTPQWRALQLTQPIRWAAGDPLERWLFAALLLDAQACDPEDISAATSTYILTEQIDREQLLADPKSLQQIFGLLVLAHYQTSPADLRSLLDGPNISVWVSRYQGHVVAAALVAAEGGFDEALAQAIWRGERRPRGHLLAQTLAVHSGLQQAPKLSYQRIMRIAVHPALQRRGLGQQLLAAITAQAREQGSDFVGTSFAASAEVIAFWQRAGFTAVRLGSRRDAASGCHSCVMLSALSAPAAKLSALARGRFMQQFPFALAGLFAQLEFEVVAALLSDQEGVAAIELDQQDHLDIEAFVRGYRQFELCTLPLWKLVFLGLALGPNPSAAQPLLSAAQWQCLIRRLMQHQPEQAVIAALGFSGKKQLNAELRQSLAILQQALTSH